MPMNTWVRPYDMTGEIFHEGAMYCAPTRDVHLQDGMAVPCPYRWLEGADDSLTNIGAPDCADQLSIFDDRQAVNVLFDHQGGGFGDVIFRLDSQRTVDNQRCDRLVHQFAAFAQGRRKRCGRASADLGSKPS